MSGVIISQDSSALWAHLLGGFPSVRSREANGHLVAQTSPNSGTIDGIILKKLSRFNQD